MIVNDVKDNSETAAMRLINKTAQIIRGAIPMVWSKQVHAIVAPAELTRELRNRHHFNHTDSDSREFWQFPRRGGPASLRSESADMHFVNNQPLQWHSAPVPIGPCELRWIDDA
jgi:hypothetical protein